MNFRKAVDSLSSKHPNNEQPNGSEWDGRSYYSDAKHRVLFKFEEKNQDYLDDDEPIHHNKPGFITNSRNGFGEERWGRPKQLSQYLSTGKKLNEEELNNYRTSIQKRGSRVGGEHIDYDSLYKQIRLPPMREEKDKEEEQTIERENGSRPNPTISYNIGGGDEGYLKQPEKDKPLKEDRTIRLPPTTPIKPASQHYSRLHDTSISVNEQSVQYQPQLEKHELRQSRQSMPQSQQHDRHDLGRSRQSVMVDQQIQTAVQWQPSQNFQKLQLPKIKTQQEQQPENALVKSRQQARQPISSNIEPTKPTLSRFVDTPQQNTKIISTEEDHMKSRLVQGQTQPIAQVFIPDSNTPLFDISTYLQIYYPLSAVLHNLRNNDLLKSIKSYLEIIATGRIDNFDFVRLPLHKKKNLRMALLYERLSVVVVSFAYATQRITDCHRYLGNLVRFSLSNYCICLKVLSAGVLRSDSPLYKQHSEIWAQANKQFQTKGLETLKDNNQILNETINKLAREDEIFFESLKKFIRNSQKFTLQQNFYYVLEYFALFLNLCELDHRIPFLAVAPNPYLPPTTTERYTLVIDLLQVMCHPKKTDCFRPYTQYFLEEMSQYYELVVFSAAYPNHLNKVIDIVDRKKRVKHRLYRHHAIRSFGQFVKDTGRLGRDLSKVILVEGNTINTGGGQQDRLSHDSTIPVRAWTGSSKDTLLAQLCPMLAMVVIKSMDARQAVRKYRQQMEKNMQSGVKYINFGMNLE